MNLKKQVLVTNAYGIHARPASMIVQAAKSFDADVVLKKDGVSADAKSIMSVMMLAAAQDSLVEIQAKGPQAQEALDAVAALFDRKFNEE